MCQKDAHELIDMATDFMNRRPQLSRGGHFEILEHDGISRLFYHRASCCHWYDVPHSGKHCTWCSRLSVEERRRRLMGLLEQETTNDKTSRLEALTQDKELACPLPHCLPPSWPA